MKTKAKALLALTGASTIWGLNAYMNKLMLPYGSAITLTSFRFFIASFCIFTYLVITKQFRIPPKKELFHLTLLGLAFVCFNSTFVFIGLNYSTVSHSSLINATSPLFISLAAVIIFKEKLLNIQWLGILLALYGTAYILTKGDISSIARLDFNKGDLFFIAAQFGWSFYTLFSSKVLKEVSVLELVFWSGLFGAIANIVAEMLLSDFALPSFNKYVYIGLFYTGIMTSLCAMTLWNFGVKNVGPSISAVFINLSTVIGVSSGIILLNEPASNSLFIGAGIVFLGLILLVQHNLIAKLFRFTKRA